MSGDGVKSAGSAARPYRRRLRNFLIYPKFQLSLLGIQALVMVATFVLMQFENRAAFARLDALGKEAALPPGHPYYSFVTKQQDVFFSHTILVFVVALALSSLVTLYLSFRLAGPIYRLRKFMWEIAEHGSEGLEPLRFRNGDFYSDLPEAVNQAVALLKSEMRVSSGASSMGMESKISAGTRSPMTQLRESE